jgi:hypothetical protein
MRQSQVSSISQLIVLQLQNGCSNDLNLQVLDCAFAVTAFPKESIAMLAFKVFVSKQPQPFCMLDQSPLWTHSKEVQT